MNRNKWIIDTLWFIAAHKHFTKIGVFKHNAESVETLFKDFCPGHKEQAAEHIRSLIKEAFIIQYRNNRLSNTVGSHHQITSIAVHYAFSLMLIQNLLLIGIWSNVHGVRRRIVGIKVFFCISVYEIVMICSLPPFSGKLTKLFHPINGFEGFTGFRNIRKLSRQSIIDDLFVKAMM